MEGKEIAGRFTVKCCLRNRTEHTSPVCERCLRTNCRLSDWVVEFAVVTASRCEGSRGNTRASRFGVSVLNPHPPPKKKANLEAQSNARASKVKSRHRTRLNSDRRTARAIDSLENESFNLWRSTDTGFQIARPEQKENELVREEYFFSAGTRMLFLRRKIAPLKRGRGTEDFHQCAVMS